MLGTFYIDTEKPRRNDFTEYAVEKRMTLIVLTVLLLLKHIACHCNVLLSNTSSSAIAERPRCRLLLQLVKPVNRQRLKCHRMQRRRANGWFSSRTKFVFKGMSPTNYFCTDRYASKCLTTLPLTVFAKSNSVADFLRDTEPKPA